MTNMSGGWKWTKESLNKENVLKNIKDSRIQTSNQNKSLSIK